jgi:hypothetical protein
LSCSSGSCAACAPNDSSCSFASDCCSGICNQGACVACGGAGSSCTTPTECCNGAPCAGGTCGGGAGACLNSNDEAVNASYDLVQESFQCFLGSCASSPTGCIASCLALNTSLGLECAACYEDGVECILANCLGQCTGSPTEPNCVSCQEQYCNAAFTACSGWPSP